MALVVSFQRQFILLPGEVSGWKVWSWCRWCPPAERENRFQGVRGFATWEAPSPDSFLQSRSPVS